MAIINDRGEKVAEWPETGTWKFENPCDEEHGTHEYTDMVCPKCMRDFCYTCSAGFWRNHGEKGENVIRCPGCGLDINV